MTTADVPACLLVFLVGYFFVYLSVLGVGVSIYAVRWYGRQVDRYNSKE